MMFCEEDIQNMEDKIWDWSLHIRDEKTIGVDAYMVDDTTVFVPIQEFSRSVIDIRDVAIAILKHTQESK
jgi:ketosteroid isomerase-like protein